MINLTNIHALDHFKRNTAQFRDRLRRTGEPEVLTVDGKAELVVQSAEAYQRLLDELERLGALAGIREGLADVKAGRTRPAKEVIADLRARQKAQPRQRRRA